MTTPSPTVASLSKVTKSFDGRTVLADISFEVAQGEFVALLGAARRRS